MHIAEPFFELVLEIVSPPAVKRKCPGSMIPACTGLTGTGSSALASDGKELIGVVRSDSGFPQRAH